MSLSTASLINSIIITILGTTLTFLSAYYWTQRAAAIKKAADLALGHQAVLDRVTVLESQLALVKQEVVPISTAFQAILIKELTHYHTPEMDQLLVKVGPPNVLTEEEEIRLILLLKERTKDMGPLISQSERDAATILPAVMARAKVEQAVLGNAEEMKLKLVSVAAVIGIPKITGMKDEGVSPDVSIPPGQRETSPTKT